MDRVKVLLEIVYTPCGVTTIFFRGLGVFGICFLEVLEVLEVLAVFEVFEVLTVFGVGVSRALEYNEVLEGDFLDLTFIE